MFKKLRNTMLLFNMISVSLVLAAAFSVIYLVTFGNMRQINEERLDSIGSMFFMPNRPLPNGSRFNDMALTDNDRFSSDYTVSFVLFVRDGRLDYVNSYLDFDNEAYAEALEKTGGLESGQIKLAGKLWLFHVAGVPFENGNKAVQRIVFLDVSDSRTMLNTLLLTLCCVSLAVLAALFLLCMRFANRAVGPIEDAYNKQKQFVANASHELRTPIAVIGASVDAIEVSGDETVASQKEWFDNIHAELKHTGGLIDELLYLAKSEHQQKENVLPTDISAVCEIACVSFEAVLYESKLKFETGIAQNIMAYADSDKIKQVVYILLDNARKYTEQGGTVRLTLSAANKWAILKVTNTAVIEKADLARIFDRFYRPNESRSTEAGGAGLGLSIAKTIVARFGGEISANSQDKKTTFTVKLRSA
jgi:signal transduction histidine kinase